MGARSPSTASPLTPSSPSALQPMSHKMTTTWQASASRLQSGVCAVSGVRALHKPREAGGITVLQECFSHAMNGPRLPHMLLAEKPRRAVLAGWLVSSAWPWAHIVVICSAELTVRETLDFAARVQGPDFGELCLTTATLKHRSLCLALSILLLQQNSICFN